MNHFLNITKKELRELLTPGSVASIVVVVIMLILIGSMVGGQVDSISSAQKVAIVNDDVDANGEPNFYSELAIESIYYYYETQYNMTEEEASEYIFILESHISDADAILSEMREKGLEYALGIGPDYSEKIAAMNIEDRAEITEYFIYKQAGIIGSTSSTITTVLISQIISNTSAQLALEVTDPQTAQFILNPIYYDSNDAHTYINGKVYSGVTPLQISTAMMSQNLMIPIIIMIIIVMIGSIVISSMGNEKENKTLETLLTLPVKRTTIVAAKLVASAITGLIFGMAYMIGMKFYMDGVMSFGNSINLADYGLSLNGIDWIIIGAMVFLAILCALGLCMILGAFVKNYKAAQTMTLPISVLAMIPMFVIMFSSWDALPGILQAIIFAIPFSHPMMVMDNLMFSNMGMVIGGIIYLVAFMVVTIVITVKIYNSDILLTGFGATKQGAKLNKMMKKKGGPDAKDR